MRPIRTLFFGVLAALLASAVAYVAFVRPKIRAWGVDPNETELALPGDELIDQPTAVETRGITIDAPASEVWPWLAQMGYGRGGWYSYEPLDSKLPSAQKILPEFQELNVGDMMPTYPGAAFEVKALEPEQALVLFTDTASMRSQVEAAATKTGEQSTPESDAMSKRMQSMPEFAASWGFYLQPQGSNKSRLIERFRIQAPNGPPAPVMNELLGTGIVLMARKQMIGIKERVERDIGNEDPVPVA